jgi:GNAT superfamily N-acetyltransferase
MTHRIRLAEPGDYAAASDLLNAAFPEDEDKSEPEKMRFWDEAIEPKYKARRHLLEVDGRIAAYGFSRIPLESYHPEKFFLTLAVHPDQQCRGLGTALYEHIISMLEQEGLLLVRVCCREDMPAGLLFLEKRGYEVEERFWKSYLDLTELDPSVYSADLERVRAKGIQIKSFPEIQSDPDWERKLYEICIHVERDMPMADTFTPPPQHEWMKLFKKWPKRISEAILLAVDGDRYVGISALERGSAGREDLFTSITGVHREYRRRRIATALKATCIAWAKNAGFKEIRTANESTNRPMLSINERLGFVKLPLWMIFTRRFREE